MELPKTPAFRLEGKRALITGASSGIGLGCAAALAEYGAEVVVAARSKDKLDGFVEAALSKGFRPARRRWMWPILTRCNRYWTGWGILIFWLILPALPNIARLWIPSWQILTR